MSVAGAADTAALQHSRLPLAYPRRRLASSQSLPVIRGLPSKLLAPPTGWTVPSVTPAPASTLQIRRSPILARPVSMNALRHPLRDRVAQTSRLTEVLRKDCLGKLDNIIDQVWHEKPFGWHFNTQLLSEDGSNATFEQLSVGEPGESLQMPGEPGEPGEAVEPENEAGSTSRASSKEQLTRSKEQPAAAPAGAKEVPLQHQRKVQKRGRGWTNPSETFSSSSSSWRCSDPTVRHGMNPVPMMRATWAHRRTVDWDVGWLEPPRAPSRSRSASPDGQRDQHMALPPMLLSHCEARRVADASRQAAAAASSDISEAARSTSQSFFSAKSSRSTSEWRLRSLFENSMKYQVRI